MNQIIKTKIDGVPVEIEMISVGPATPVEILALEKSLNSENTEPISSNPLQITKIKVGDDKTPATAADVEKVQKALSGKKDAATLISDLAQSVKENPNGKDWWKSKTIWVNLISIVVTVLTYFGIDAKVNPQLETAIVTIAPLIIGMLNLYLRKGTDIKINSKIIPPIKTSK